MSNGVKKLIISLATLAVIVVVCVLLNLKEVETFHEKYEGADLSVDVEGAVREGTYSRYLNAHADAVCPGTDVAVDLFQYTSEGDVEVYDNYEGVEKSLYTAQRSKVTWEVEVPEAGFYNLYLEYFAPESRGVAAERAVYINGELPFEDAYNMTFSRIWTDGGEVRIDNQGNQIRPTQVEVFDWQHGYCRDTMGYVSDPYKFYFNQGVNTL